MLFLFKRVNVFTKSAFVYAKAKGLNVNFVKNRGGIKSRG